MRKTKLTAVLLLAMMTSLSSGCGVRNTIGWDGSSACKLVCFDLQFP